MHKFGVGGAGWRHDILVGGLAEAAAEVRAVTGAGPVPLVSDRRILDLHGARVAEHFAFEPLVVPEGEAAKDWTSVRRLIAGFSEFGLTRDQPVIALGGGSVGDVAGLAASLYMRGVPLIAVPTTLLAQVDSAVGGKTAIDVEGRKNLVGAFHSPALVVCDTAFLATLDPRQLRAGYGEAVKYGLIDDPDFFDWCEANGAALIAGDRALQDEAVSICLKAKARLIGNDLRDTAGRRALLNLGHSFAHAIEAATGFGRVLHGEAVAVGLVLALSLSSDFGHCAPEAAERVAAHLRCVGLPTALGDVGLGSRGGELLPHLLKDKKAAATGPVLILARGIGKAFVARDVPVAAIRAFLERAP